MRIMIDTNVFISAALSPNGTSAKAFIKAISPPFQPVVCDYIVDELHRKFQEKFPKKMIELEAFLYDRPTKNTQEKTTMSDFEIISSASRIPNPPALISENRGLSTA